MKSKLWYHDFEVLGVKTEQKPGPYRLNQLAKQDIIFKLIDGAILLCKGTRYEQDKMIRHYNPITGVELFCADGFYSNYAAKKHRTRIRGIDLSEGHLKRAREITKTLGNEDRVAFTHCDVMDLDAEYDFGICAGGLYHLSDPASLLGLLRVKIKTALVIQTVFSLKHTEKDYFETPAPGRKAGCRFSYDHLIEMVVFCGWEIIEKHSNELGGNTWLEDRGSAYLLCT